MPNKAVVQAQLDCGLGLVILLDQSASLSTTDPVRLRHELANYIFRWWGENFLYSQSGCPLEIALANFGETSTVVLEPTQLHTQTLADLEEHLYQIALLISENQIIEPFGKGDYLLGLETAQTLFADMLKSTNKSLIIVTDGELPSEPDDYRILLTQYIQSTFPRPGHDILVIGMGEPNMEFWQSATEGNVFWASRPSLVLENLVLSLVNLNRLFGYQQSQTVQEVIEPGAYFVPPYLQKVTFSLFRDSLSSNISIITPEGTEFSEDMPGVSVR